MSKYWYKPGIDVTTTDPLVEALERYADKANVYNDIMKNNGVAKLRVNDNEYDVVIDNISNEWMKEYPEFTGTIRALTPRVNYSNMYNSYREQVHILSRAEYKNYSEMFGMSIKNVLFREPATIVFWVDGTKTVVKADGEAYDPEKGLAMAIAKKVLGNQGNYYNVFKKWLPEEEAVVINYDGKSLVDAFADAKEEINRFAEAIKDCETCEYYGVSDSCAACRDRDCYYPKKGE